MSKAVICPECKTPVGGDSGTDPYKHAVNCFHIGKGRPEDLVSAMAQINKEAAARLAVLLDVPAAK